MLLHEVHVKNIIDWVSSVGGVYGVIFAIAYFFIGNYQYYISTISAINSLYSIKSIKNKKSNKKPKLLKIKLTI